MLDYKLLDKLREKYHKAAEKHGKKFFDEVELEKRIQDFLRHSARSQSTFEKFLTDEMLFFKEIEEKLEQKKEEEERKNTPSRTDELLQEQQKKMEKYPDRFFDPGATMQMRYFVGGYSQIYHNDFPAASYMFGGSYLWKELRQTSAEIERFYQPAGKSTPFLLQQYGKEARFLSQDGRLKLDQKMMQTAGINFYRFMEQSRQAYDDLTTSMKTQTIAFGPSEIQLLREMWNGKTFAQATQKIEDDISGFLKDFGIYDLVEFSIKNKEKAQEA